MHWQYLGDHYRTLEPGNYATNGHHLPLWRRVDLAQHDGAGGYYEWRFESVTAAPPGFFDTVLPTDWQCAASGKDSCYNGVGVFAPGTADILNTTPFYVYSPFPDQSPALGNFVGADPCYGQSPGAACSTANGSSTVYQDVGVLTPGNYVVTFWQASAQWYSFTGATDTQWEVGLGSTCLISCGSGFIGEIDYFQLMVNTPGGNGTTGTYVPWELETLSFTVPSTASGTDEVLSFVALGNIAVPPIVFLDGVNLQAAPEPGTLLMLGSILLGLSVAGLRRHTRRRGLSVVGADNMPSPATPDRDGNMGAC